MLIETYKSLRRADSRGARRSGYRVTVRQLESLIRLSEAMARAHAEPEVKLEHVRAASRLLRSSMPQTEKGDVDLEEEDQPGLPLDAATREEENQEHQEALFAAVDQVLAGEQPQPKSTTIKSNEYHRICQLLLSMMSEKERRRSVKKAMQVEQQQATTTAGVLEQDTDMGSEEVASPAVDKDADEDQDFGMKMKDLVNWYMEQVEEQLQDEEEYFAEVKMVKKIIKRMIRKVCFNITFRLPRHHGVGSFTVAHDIAGRGVDRDDGRLRTDQLGR